MLQLAKCIKFYHYFRTCFKSACFKKIFKKSKPEACFILDGINRIDRMSVPGQRVRKYIFVPYIRRWRREKQSFFICVHFWCKSGGFQPPPLAPNSRLSSNPVNLVYPVKKMCLFLPACTFERLHFFRFGRRLPDKHSRFFRRFFPR